MTSTVTRKVPPSGLTRMGNPVVSLLLRSSLHGLLDGSVLLLRVTGRKTGRRYDIPVGYADIDGRLTIVTTASWRVNLRGGADVEVTMRGCRRTMHALLTEDPAAVAVAYQSVIGRLGWDKARHHLGISTRDGRPPTALELKDAAREYGWSVITLTPR
jgi:hypothetical protein